MAGAAAIFDLDRTLLRGSSAPVFSEAFFEAGLSGRAGLPGQGLMMRAYDVLGETLPSMALARAAAFASRGKRVEDVIAAARIASARLERDVVPWVHPLLDSHRDAGRLLVLATTSPYDLVRPLADRLGFDHIVATRYGTRVDRNGDLRYTGNLDGGFVWAAGKLSAVRRWAASARVSLADSWAYSDSIYDLPLLMAVGHPTAVNPDYRLVAAAVLRRWPIVHLDAPPGVPKLLGAEPQDLVRLLSPRAAYPYARFDIAGTEHIPRRGAVIIAANHRSYFDAVTIGLTVFEGGRHPRGLAKKEMFDAPVIGQLMKSFGAICVDRAGDPKAAFRAAEAALQAGECITMMPQGTIPRGEDFFEPRLTGKSGVARLAASTGAKVIPVGIWNSEAVWPRSARVPNVTNVLHPPTVRVRVGPPVRGLSGTDAHADTQRIMDAIVDQLPPEARLARIPHADEVARAMPPG
jgi:putative phosphoserine phosphatase/1-acylglycerol-3-phosphate O-acyltransferase